MTRRSAATAADRLHHEIRTFNPTPTTDSLAYTPPMCDKRGMTHSPEDLSRSAGEHLWMHFTRHSGLAENPPPVIVRGEGAYVFDAEGKRYLDGLAGLFAVQVGHGRTELAEAAAKQTAELAYFPSGATPTHERWNWPSG
ncbi:hypothetical protein GCM10029964_074670 [Kibdelosporangium lantanae]